MTLADFINLVENRSGMIAALKEEAEVVMQRHRPAWRTCRNSCRALEFEANLLREDEEGVFFDPF